MEEEKSMAATATRVEADEEDDRSFLLISQICFCKSPYSYIGINKLFLFIYLFILIWKFILPPILVLKTTYGRKKLNFDFPILFYFYFYYFFKFLDATNDLRSVLMNCNDRDMKISYPPIIAQRSREKP